MTIRRLTHTAAAAILRGSRDGARVAGVKPGPLFGASYLTQRGTQLPAPEALVWSRDGRLLAFNRRLPTAELHSRACHFYASWGISPMAKCSSQGR